jgi:Pyridoxamine 5'-phosphate oxidase
MPGKLMDYFNKSPRLGTLSTASKDGKVDSAVFGSPRMTDDKTVVMGLGKGRSLANLQQNPHAVFLIMEPGKSLAEWKGIRVYLKMKTAATSGPQLDGYRTEIGKVIGADAAKKMIHAMVTFEVTELRPLVDMGQGWETSI